jgi:RNA polymerase sigma-70 factor (ECF subfamily)
VANGALTTESELIDGLRQRDPAAYRLLVEQNSANVYNVALKLLGDEQEAEDVLQETFLSAFEAVDSFEARSKLSTWLYRIAYNASLMRIRKRKQMTTFSLDRPALDDAGLDVPVSRQLVDWSSLPDDELLTAEARQEMDQAIAQLPEALRSAFVLRDIQGLSGAETAEVLGITVPAVKTRLHRARLRLRDHLSDYFSERVTSARALA